MVEKKILRKNDFLKRAFIRVRNFMSWGLLLSLAACAGNGADMYRDPNMDFGAVRNVAVMPFVNLSRDQAADERVRDVFITALLATGAVYVIPPGEVAKGIGLAGIVNPGAPSTDEIKKLAALIKTEAVITGVVKEYGDVRSGTATANVISVSLQMVEAQTGRVVWSATTTKGGIGMKDRLLGGGGEPMNTITLEAVHDLINQLFD